MTLTTIITVMVLFLRPRIVLDIHIILTVTSFLAICNMSEYVLVCINMHASVPMLVTSIQGLGRTGLRTLAPDKSVRIYCFEYDDTCIFSVHTMICIINYTSATLVRTSSMVSQTAL